MNNRSGAGSTGENDKNSVYNKGVGLCNEAVPVQVRPKGGWELKDSSPLGVTAWECTFSQMLESDHG